MATSFLYSLERGAPVKAQRGGRVVGGEIVGPPDGVRPGREGEWPANESGASGGDSPAAGVRSEEHTSELQSHVNLVCRLLLEKKKKREHIRFSREHVIRPACIERRAGRVRARR